MVLNDFFWFSSNKEINFEVSYLLLFFLVLDTSSEYFNLLQDKYSEFLKKNIKSWIIAFYVYFARSELNNAKRFLKKC